MPIFNQHYDFQHSYKAHESHRWDWKFSRGAEVSQVCHENRYKKRLALTNEHSDTLRKFNTL